MSHETSDQTHCPDCALGDFKRNHYFTGKLLVERDFTDEQRFHIDKLRHHHQRLHGWGVVCGLKVKQHPSAQSDCLIIEPGTAIDCCGHEILVREEVPFHFSGAPALKALQALQPSDTTPHTLQICIKYKECGTEQIPVLFDECGCDETRCAPNRILESYELDVLVVEPREPPEASEEDCAELLWKGLDSCPSCDTADCVVLATIENYYLDDKVEDQTDPPSKPEDDLTAHIARIDNRTGRRLLPSTQVLSEVVECILEHTDTGGEAKQGPAGPAGPGIDDADATALPPGSGPTATLDPVGATPRKLHLGIPQGAAGNPGASAIVAAGRFKSNGEDWSPYNKGNIKVTPLGHGFFDVDFSAFANHPDFRNYIVKGIVITKLGGDQTFVLQAAEGPHTVTGITVQILPAIGFLGFMIEITDLQMLS